MFLEYDWTFNVYRPRFGASFISIGPDNVRSFDSLDYACTYLATLGLRIAGKSASRTWRVILIKGA